MLPIIKDELWEEAGELILAVSREEIEVAWDGVCDELFQRMCKTYLSVDNLILSIKLQSALPKCGSSL